ADPGRAAPDLARLSFEPSGRSTGPMPAEDIFAARSSGGGGANDPATVAADRRDALLLLLAAAVARGHAEVAMIHEVADDGAVAVCARGPQVFEALGLRTKLLDPALIAAAAGTIILTEPMPG